MFSFSAPVTKTTSEIPLSTSPVAKIIAVFDPAHRVSTLTQIELGLIPSLWATIGAVFKELEFLPAVVDAKIRPSISFGCSPGMSLDIAIVASCSISKIVAALTPNLLVPPPTMHALFICGIEISSIPQLISYIY
jgi:hypothetical protein